jgi:hypothetical protein
MEVVGVPMPCGGLDRGSGNGAFDNAIDEGIAVEVNLGGQWQESVGGDDGVNVPGRLPGSRGAWVRAIIGLPGLKPGDSVPGMTVRNS